MHDYFCTGRRMWGSVLSWIRDKTQVKRERAKAKALESAAIKANKNIETSHVCTKGAARAPLYVVVRKVMLCNLRLMNYK